MCSSLRAHANLRTLENPGLSNLMFGIVWPTVWPRHGLFGADGEGSPAGPIVLWERLTIAQP